MQTDASCAAREGRPARCVDSLHDRSVDSRTGGTVYEGPDAGTVDGLMEELVGSIKWDGGASHVVRAAMAHLNLAMIHPFKVMLNWKSFRAGRKNGAGVTGAPRRFRGWALAGRRAGTLGG